MSKLPPAVEPISLQSWHELYYNENNIPDNENIEIQLDFAPIIPINEEINRKIKIWYTQRNNLQFHNTCNQLFLIFKYLKGKEKLQ